MSSFTTRNARRFLVFAALITILATGQNVLGQSSRPAPIAAVAPLNGKWEDIDQRFLFLTVELSSTETSLNAINKAIAGTGYQQSSQQQKAQTYQKGNEIMDRSGGGPIPWQDFYGKTAESFYYHPYTTVQLHAQESSQSPRRTSQGELDLKAHSTGDQTMIERPPQLDFIYRANSDAEQRAEAEVAKLGNQIDQLTARRRQLEEEQSALWCKIAFHGLTTRELMDKPLYRMDPMTAVADDEHTQELSAVATACKFMRTVNALADQAQEAIDGNQAAVYSKLAEVIKQSRSDLKTTLLMQPALQAPLDDENSPLGQFSAAAKRLEDSSQNLSDAYGLALDGDKAGDMQRKLSFRGAIQQMTMDFAATVMTADEALTAAAAQWKITPDVKKPTTQESTVWIALSAKPSQDNITVSPPSAGVAPQPQPAAPSDSASNDQGNTTSNPPAGPSQDMQAAINAERDRIASIEGQPLGGEPYTSDQTLSQTKTPYDIQKVFGPPQGSRQLKVTVAPGVEIRDGKIDLLTPGNNGDAALLLAGTPGRPIILRNVVIDLPLHGAFKASNVIFDQCTFEKAGKFFSNFSSKWEMDQCLLYKSTFPNLRAVDYGFKLTNCTFVDVNFPEIEHKNADDMNFDYMDHLRKEWNIIQSCSFVNCTVYPTVFWCSETSDFWNCTFLPGVAFDSASPTKVTAFVYGTTGESPVQIAQENPPKRATLTIVQHGAPYPVYRWATNCPVPEVRLDDSIAKIVLTNARGG